MTETQIDDQDDQLLKGSASSPGTVLKRAREAKNLSQRDIANSLKLSVAMVEALEREDQKQLPPEIFVRGYYRSYAKLVGISDLFIEEEPSGSGPKLTNDRSSEKGKVKFPWVKLILAVAAVVAAVVVWQQKEGEPSEQETNPPSAPAETEKTAPRLDKPFVETQPINSAEEAVQTQTDEAEQSAEQTLPAAQPVAEAQETLEQNNQEQAVQVEEESITPSQAAANYTVVINYNGQSWTEIKSANGDRLVFGLVNDGDTKTITDGFPLNLKLGNASNVSVAVNGSAIDLTPFIRGNVARLILDPSKY